MLGHSVTSNLLKQDYTRAQIILSVNNYYVGYLHLNKSFDTMHLLYNTVRFILI